MVAQRLADESFFPSLVEWANAHDEDFVKLWAGRAYQYPLSVEQLKDVYKDGINSVRSGVFIYQIYDEVISNDWLGSVQFVRMNMELKQAYIGRFMIRSEEWRGKGLGKAALREMVRIGFEDFGLETIKLNVFDVNTRAIRCYESVGFSRGIVTEHVYTSKSGQSWSNMEMSLNKADWVKSGTQR